MDLKISSLDYKFIPSRSGKQKSLLLLAHGRGGNKKLLEFYSKRFSLENLSYLCLQAPNPEQREDQVERGETGWSWWFSPGAKQIEDSRVRLRTALHEIWGQGFQPEDIFWLGFSQGAGMGLDLFLRSDEKFGGALCISGLLPRAQEYPEAFGKAARDQNLLITHGSRDEIITLESAEKTYQPLREHQIPFEWKLYDKPHSFHLKEEVPYLESKLRLWTGNS